MAYLKPQSPIKLQEDHIYPLTTVDQIIMEDGQRLSGVGVYLEKPDENEDTTVEGVNADTLGGMAASDYVLEAELDTYKDNIATNYLLKTETAVNSNLFGGKEPRYYIQPRNLLDNSNFGHPVNQRGSNSYSLDSGYTIDRWRTHWSGSDCSVEIREDNCIRLYRPTYSMYLFQHMENSADMVGKTYTLAAKVRYHGIIGWIDDTHRPNVQYSSNDWGIVTLTFTVGAATCSIGNCAVEISNIPNQGFDVSWIALYEGEYTSDNLPPYIPKGYAAELAECKLYYRRFGANTILYGHLSSNATNFYTSFNDLMRAAPKVTWTAALAVRTHKGYSSIATHSSPSVPTNITCNLSNGVHYFYLAFNNATIADNNVPATVMIVSGEIELSADL